MRGVSSVTFIMGRISYGSEKPAHFAFVCGFFVVATSQGASDSAFYVRDLYGGEYVYGRGEDGVECGGEVGGVEDVGGEGGEEGGPLSRYNFVVIFLRELCVGFGVRWVGGVSKACLGGVCVGAVGGCDAGGGGLRLTSAHGA